MAIERSTPLEIAKRAADRRAKRLQGVNQRDGAWRRETYCLPRVQAREKAMEWFQRYPKSAYMTEIEFWRDSPTAASNSQSGVCPAQISRDRSIRMFPM